MLIFNLPPLKCSFVINWILILKTYEKKSNFIKRNVYCHSPRISMPIISDTGIRGYRVIDWVFCLAWSHIVISGLKSSHVFNGVELARICGFFGPCSVEVVATILWSLKARDLWRMKIAVIYIIYTLCCFCGLIRQTVLR